MARKPKLRKPNFKRNSIQVNVCGKQIEKDNDLICSLPPNHPFGSHSCVAQAYNGAIIAVVQSADEDPEIWEILKPPDERGETNSTPPTS